MAKRKKPTPRRRRAVPLPSRVRSRPGTVPPALSPTLWADAYRQAEAAGQLRPLESEPRGTPSLMPTLARLCPGCRLARITRGTYCPACARRHELLRGSPTTRGYGYAVPADPPGRPRAGRLPCRLVRGPGPRRSTTWSRSDEGGDSSEENLVASCLTCNSRRGGNDDEAACHRCECRARGTGLRFRGSAMATGWPFDAVLNSPDSDDVRADPDDASRRCRRRWRLHRRAAPYDVTRWWARVTGGPIVPGAPTLREVTADDLDR